MKQKFKRFEYALYNENGKRMIDSLGQYVNGSYTIKNDAKQPGIKDEKLVEVFEVEINEKEED